MYKTVYDAENTLDAHMILHMLEQAHIHAHIEGQYLQGGIGELPAGGIVRVIVDEDDYPLARDIIDQWQIAQPVEEIPRINNPDAKQVYFLAGMLAGGFLMFLFLIG